jgi:hypothetical protein
MKNIKFLTPFLAAIIICGCNKEKIIPPVSQQLISVDTVPNGDFERWNYLRLENWTTNSCPFCTPPFETYIVQQDSDSYQGVYAAKFIYNNAYPATAENRFAISSHPNNLSAYVKCTISGVDTVFIKIKLLSNSILVDSGLWAGTVSIPAYAQIQIPITQNSSSADSAVILIQGGHESGVPPFNNTEFWVDDLQLQ